MRSVRLINILTTLQGRGLDCGRLEALFSLLAFPAEQAEMPSNECDASRADWKPSSIFR